MNKKIGIGILAVMLLCGKAYSQQIEEKIEITFNLNGYVVEPAIEINEESMQTLNDIVKRVETDSLFSITSITVDSYASPEGDSYYNQKLSARRSMSMYHYLRDELNIADSLITTTSRGVVWERLREMVIASDMANRDEVIDIIDNVPEEKWRRINPTDRWQTLVDSRNKHLMDLRGGRPYKYMQQNFFPKLRSGSIVTIYYRRPEKPIIEGEMKIITPELELP
ncbi:MAG: OmpA family protein, partial [Rikenellaceae bacterium]